MSVMIVPFSGGACGVAPFYERYLSGNRGSPQRQRAARDRFLVQFCESVKGGLESDAAVRDITGVMKGC
ncbi:hypothetical protein [Lacticaseibacillus kribbianus]|uniref:hypothetical protein n=1 Tax=Lacticaseibacillus kribbianus TaxID=2926292 RepID=UPI001CD63B7A|nr:hypothetical protein [Lacticaseibacillus kribbianus]